MEDHANCPACGAGEQGLVITFPDATTCLKIQRAIVADFAHCSRPLDEHRAWFELKYAYDCLPYWEEFYEVESWGLTFANASPTGIITPVASLSWQELKSTKPDLWIDDVIRFGRIRMMKQPIVDVRHAKTIGFEMLARGLREDGSIISPGELYAAARNQSQLFRLDRACRMAAIEASQALRQDTLVFVNFVPTSIYVPEHCLATTIATVDKLSINRRRIVFEVVETDQVQDTSHLDRILSYYRNTGFRCALDDFGEGFNDAGMLRALQPDIVKLDRKYVTQIDTDATKREVARQIHREGTAIGATMLAEGVESEAEAKVLAALGYDWQQGYWYGRPDWDAMDVDDQQLRGVMHYS